MLNILYVNSLYGFVITLALYRLSQNITWVGHFIDYSFITADSWCDHNETSNVYYDIVRYFVTYFYMIYFIQVEKEFVWIYFPFLGAVKSHLIYKIHDK